MAENNHASMAKSANTTANEPSIVATVPNGSVPSDADSNNTTPKPVGSPVQAIRALQKNQSAIAKDPFENHGDDALFKKCIACVDDSVSSDLVFIEAEGFEIETFWQEVEQKVVNIRNSADSQPFVKLNADGIDLSIFKPLLTCREYTFALHLTNVGIEAIEANDIGPNWFRSLSLVGSPLSTSFVTTNLTMLLYLDVSFSEISLANFDASGLGKLRYLSLEGCSLESLHTGKDDGNEQSHWLSCLESLESLNLSDNEFAVC